MKKLKEGSKAEEKTESKAFEKKEDAKKKTGFGRNFIIGKGKKKS